VRWCNQQFFHFPDLSPKFFLGWPRDRLAQRQAQGLTASAFSFRLTVPGGARVAVAAVSTVTVHPTHRRRGVLRQMMDEQLDDVARRHEPLAVLTASEASIYERFGYGTATFATQWELDSDHATMRAPASADGAVRLIEGVAAADAARSVYDRVAPTNELMTMHLVTYMEFDEEGQAKVLRTYGDPGEIPLSAHPVGVG
jgi:predicted acetyltransferase